MLKPVVHYLSPSSLDVKFVVGKSTFVSPVDHPHCSNRGVVRTSEIVKVGENGEFETMNTIYRPVVKQ